VEQVFESLNGMLELAIHPRMESCAETDLGTQGLCKLSQNLEVNFTSRSEMIVLGTP
jgi:hypothetical protein